MRSQQEEGAQGSWSPCLSAEAARGLMLYCLREMGRWVGSASRAPGNVLRKEWPPHWTGKSRINAAPNTFPPLPFGSENHRLTICSNYLIYITTGEKIKN